MPRKSSSKYTAGRQVTDLLDTRTPGLGKILDHARQLDRLDQLLTGLMEPELSQHVRVAALRDGCLVLITPSAAVATRLKMDGESLLTALRNTGTRGIDRLKIRTAPLPGRRELPRRRKHLPDVARQSLERFAQDSGDSEIFDLISKRDGKTGD